MIYLKKNEEEQELFIPKNGNYEGKKTFKDGVEYQKSLLSPIKFLKNGEYENPNGWNKVTVDVPLGEHTITKNGIYDARNGYLVRGGNNIGTVFMLKGGGYVWNVNPANTLKIELLFKPANEYGEFFDNTIRGIFGYDFEIGKFYVAEDAQNPNLIYASVGGWESERVELTPEWHIISLSNSEFRIDGVLIANIPEGEYAPLNTQILLNGINNANGNSNYYYPNVGFYANFKVWADGVGVVDASPYFEDNSTYGYLNLYGGRLNTEIWRVTNNWIALDEVNEPSFIEVQGFNYLTVNVPTGGECPELQELNVNSNGRYEGAYNIVNVDVPDTNGSYDEGYNNGYNDGLNNRECPECPEYTQIEITENGIYDGYFDRVNVVVPQEGGSCNLEETRWGNPLPFDVNENYLIIQPSMGYDGMKKVALNMEDYNTEKYNEGYEAGKAEGGSCNLGELNIEWASSWKQNHYYANRQGLDGYNVVSINAENALNEKYNEGYEAGRAELGELNVTENGTYTGAYNVVNVNVPQEGNITSSAVEEEYNTLAFRTKNVFDYNIIVDKTKLVDYYANYVENGHISYTQNKNGIVITKKPEFSNPLVSGIEREGLNWNCIDKFYSFTISTFGVDMTRALNSNVREVHLDSPVMNTDGADVVFRSGCFATSNRLNKIVFYKPLKIMVYDNAFEGVNSSGEVVVVGEDNTENRAKYDTLMSQLGDGWYLNFVNQYNE